MCEKKLQTNVLFTDKPQENPSPFFCSYVPSNIHTHEPIERPFTVFGLRIFVFLLGSSQYLL
jgi:hypothetical protein